MKYFIWYEDNATELEKEFIEEVKITFPN